VRREPVDVALFGDGLDRALHSALAYDAERLQAGLEQGLRRSSAEVHALDARLTDTLRRGWVVLNEAQPEERALRFCLTACGVAHFKAWVWVCPIGRLFDGTEPQKEVMDRLRLMRSLAPNAQGLVWLTPSPRITQFELNRAPHRIQELLKDSGILSAAPRLSLPKRGPEGMLEALKELLSDGELAAHEATGARGGSDPRVERVIALNERLISEPRLSAINGAERTELDLDALAPILEGSYEGVDQQLWRVEEPYYIAQTLMTRGLYEKLMGVDTSYVQLSYDPDLPYLKPPPRQVNFREPISRVSWLTATRTCNALSAAHGLPAYYRYESPEGELCSLANPPDDATFERGGWAVWADLSARASFRLPLSDEWCYAASARQPHPYAGGEDSELLAWSAHNSGSKLHPVASLASNRWGLYDMNGLLWEWCEDGPSERQIQSSERWGSREGMRLVCDGVTQAKWLLGGSWANHPWVFPIGERLSELPTYADDFMGLRVIRSAR